MGKFRASLNSSQRGQLCNSPLHYWPAPERNCHAQVHPYPDRRPYGPPRTALGAQEPDPDACRLRGRGFRPPRPGLCRSLAEARDLAMAHCKIALRPYYAGSGLGQRPVSRTRPEPGSPGWQGGERSQLVSTTALAAISPVAAEPVDLRLAELRRMVLNSVVSEHSKRNYAKALDDLFLFAASRPLTRALLMEWRAAMNKLSPSTINVRLSAMRKLVTEARRNGMLGAEEAANLTEVPNMPEKGTRIGNWLTREQAKELLAVPDRSTLKGKRDYAILALLVGCALRRQELAELDIEKIQMRERRWVITDLRGKGGRIRTVAIPVWVKNAIDAWMTVAGIDKGRLLRSISKSGKLNRDSLSDWAVWSIVEQSAKQIGIEHFGAHDLRRYAECRIMPNRNLSPQDVGWPGSISGESIRHNRADYRLLKNPRSLSSGW